MSGDEGSDGVTNPEQDKMADSPVPVKRPAEDGDAEETPEKKIKMAAAEETAEEEVDKKGRSEDLVKLWRTVEEDPADFTGWTYLLQHVDGAGVEHGREAYDAFLFRYPYCYGYWKKYADLEKKKGDPEACIRVFERGVVAIPLSADLWIHYLNHVRNQSTDQDHIREHYERAVKGCGREWRSDKLWDHYVKWEIQTKNYEKVLGLYDRILRNQTQGLSHQFDMFREFVKDHEPKVMLDSLSFLDMRKEILASLSKAKKGELITTENENQAMRESIIFERRKLFKETEEKVQARWKFEDNIKRPYFHMKPLERSQLKNWSDYLRVESEKIDADVSAVEILYERCIIACALYEEFWMKYVQWLESFRSENEKEAVDKIRNVYTRACVHHLPAKVDINLAWAAFEEREGCVEKAAEILEKLHEKHAQLLSVILRRINLERRRGNNSKVHELFKSCINSASSSSVASEISVKYARFLRLGLNNEKEAESILDDALIKDPKNPKLHLQLLDLHLHQLPLNKDKVLKVFDTVLSEGLNLPPNHKLLFLQRKLDFLEDFGNCMSEVSQVQSEVSKLRVELKDVATAAFKAGEASKNLVDPKDADKDSKASSKKSVNGSTTYSATNSASYGAQHASQYQQYGSRYATAAGAQYPSSYGQYGSYYQSYYQQ